MVEGLTPRELDELARAVRQISLDITAIREKVTGTAAEAKKATTEVAEKVQRVKLESEKLADAFAEVSSEARATKEHFKQVSLDRMVRDAERFGRSLLTVKSTLFDIRKSDIESLRLAALRRAEYEKSVASLTRVRDLLKHGAEGSPRGQLAGRALGVLGEKGVVGAAQSGLQTIRGLMADVPFGGIFGMLMWGGVKSQEWEAQVHRSMRQFSAVTSTWRSRGLGLRGMLLEMRKEWLLDPQEIASLTGAFAAGGAGEDIAGAKTGDYKAPSGFAQNILGLSLALDTTANAATGTFAKAIVESMAVSGAAVKSVADEVAGIALGFKDTGVNVSALLSGLLQMQGSLRFQRQGIADLAAVYKVAHTAMMGPGGLFQDTPEGRVAASGYAQAGLQSLTQSVAGLSIGMSVELARRSDNKLQDLDAWAAMQEGRLGAPGRHFSTVVAEMGKLVREIAPGDENQQKFAAMKLFGVDFAGANVLLKVQDAIEQGLPVDKAVEKYQAELNKAFRDRSKDTADWQKRMEQLTQGMALIAGATLGAVSSGVQLLAGYLNIIEDPDTESVKRVLGNIQTDYAAGFSALAESGKGMFSAFSPDRYSFGAVKAAEKERRDKLANLFKGTVVDDQLVKVYSQSPALQRAVTELQKTRNGSKTVTVGGTSYHLGVDQASGALTLSIKVLSPVPVSDESSMLQHGAAKQ